MFVGWQTSSLYHAVTLLTFSVLIHVPLCISYTKVSGRCDSALRAHPSLLTLHPARLLCLTLLFLLSAPWLILFSALFLPSISLVDSCLFHKPHIVTQPFFFFFTFILPVHSATSGPANILLSHACYMQPKLSFIFTLIPPPLPQVIVNDLLIILWVCSAHQWILVFSFIVLENIFYFA